MSLALILVTCVIAAGAAVAIASFNIWLGLLAAWPIYKLCDVTCRAILRRQ